MASVTRLLHILLLSLIASSAIAAPTADQSESQSTSVASDNTFSQYFNSFEENPLHKALHLFDKFRHGVFRTDEDAVQAFAKNPELAEHFNLAKRQGVSNATTAAETSQATEPATTSAAAATTSQAESSASSAESTAAETTSAPTTAAPTTAQTTAVQTTSSSSSRETSSSSSESSSSSIFHDLDRVFHHVFELHFHLVYVFIEFELALDDYAHYEFDDGANHQHQLDQRSDHALHIHLQDHYHSPQRPAEHRDCRDGCPPHRNLEGGGYGNQGLSGIANRQCSVLQRAGTGVVPDDGRSCYGGHGSVGLLRPPYLSCAYMALLHCPSCFIMFYDTSLTILEQARIFFRRPTIVSP
ncbi:hypothetical protein ASPCADRAFT_133231 [Aspergillus carbonarius ITEM 5010]|uniref:Inhibitor I9 domain-containing protein n=1 Tax=Aspergillus carbonarius (strain ITEM 5010) TaxID=602072 RepID=A0A1R3RED7_ASPC5|nr:hypothetical protein ASPCADRAFT_133231 [Aspergillus carbonarius ITEM 5010]